MSHPSTMPRVSTLTLSNLRDQWKSRAAAADEIGDTTIADVWRVAIDDVSQTITGARAEWLKAADARRPKASIDVENRAIARQLKDTATNFNVQSADYLDQSHTLREAGQILAAKEAHRASEIAAEKAIRSEKALEILLEHTGLDPTEI